MWRITYKARNYFVWQKINMKVNFFYNIPDNNNFLTNFLLDCRSIKFKHYKDHELKKFINENNLLIISNKTKFNDFKILYKQLSKLDFENLIYLLPINYSNEQIDKKENKIFYPKNFSQFINQLKIFFSQKIHLNKEICLSNDNLLINTKTNKKIYLTEIESKLVNLLIKNNYVNKEQINRLVLGHKTKIDSKSLDTHLYRLRTKIIAISDDIRIEYDDKKNIKLTTTNL